MAKAFELLSDTQKKEFWAALALKYTKSISPRLLRKLGASYGSFYAVFSALTNSSLENPQSEKFRLSPACRSELKSEAWREEALKEWQQSKSFEGEVLLWTDYRYPVSLKRISDAPPFLYIRGDSSLLSKPTVAIVGSRKCHSLTVEKVKEISAELSSCGICVVSGFARGIDYAAHVSAMEHMGKSIAVFGCGIDVIYPKEHKNLYHEMHNKDALFISEFPPHSAPLAVNFPIRNRIITAISEGVLVAEAALKSGSLITARLALEHNKHVYVLEPHHENHSLGCHSLIADGAAQVKDAYDIIMDLAPNLVAEASTYEAEKSNSKEKEESESIFDTFSKEDFSEEKSLECEVFPFSSSSSIVSSCSSFSPFPKPKQEEFTREELTQEEFIKFTTEVEEEKRSYTQKRTSQHDFLAMWYGVANENDESGQNGQKGQGELKQTKQNEQAESDGHEEQSLVSQGTQISQAVRTKQESPAKQESQSVNNSNQSLDTVKKDSFFNTQDSETFFTAKGHYTDKVRFLLAREEMPSMKIDFSKQAKELMGKPSLHSISWAELAKPKKSKKKKSLELSKQEFSETPSSKKTREILKGSHTREKILAKKQNQNMRKEDENILVSSSSIETKDKMLQKFNVQSVHSQEVNRQALKSQDTKNQEVKTQEIELKKAELFSSLNDFEKAIVFILEKHQSLIPDELFSHLPEEYKDMRKILSQLMMLEIRKIVRRQAGNRYSLGENYV